MIIAKGSKRAEKSLQGVDFTTLVTALKSGVSRVDKLMVLARKLDTQQMTEKEFVKELKELKTLLESVGRVMEHVN